MNVLTLAHASELLPHRYDKSVVPRNSEMWALLRDLIFLIFGIRIEGRDVRYFSGLGYLEHGRRCLDMTTR